MKKYNKAKRKMINFDDVTKENIKKKSKLAENSLSPMHNIDNCRF